MNGGIKISLLAAGLATAGCAATQTAVQIRPIADPASKLRPGADRLADAKGQLAIGNVGLALEGFRGVARIYPDNAEAYIGMAACYEQMRRFDLAESKYQAALALDPRNATLLGRLAAALDQQGKTDEAAGVRGEIAALQSASTVLEQAQAEPNVAPATLAPAQTVSVALPKAAAAQSPLAHVLTSAMGASEASPDVTRVELRRGDAVLLCTDGLTKHVSDDRIAERMRARTSAEQVVRALVDDALAGGGTDNVTVLVVAGVRRE